MQAKDIKRLVINQLKIHCPRWRRLTRTPKKVLAKQALAEVMADYKEEQWKPVPLPELTNMPDLPPGIIALHEVEIAAHQHRAGKEKRLKHLPLAA